VVDVVGFTAGFEAVFVYPDGLDVHEYVFPLTAVPPMEALPPKQIGWLVPVFAAGSGFTVITTESDLVQLVAVIVSDK